MAANKAFEPDYSNETERRSTNRQPSDIENLRTNENDEQLDTYFSDEKIPIPERVSLFLYTHQRLNKSKW